jgi:cytidylate kinase
MRLVISGLTAAGKTTLARKLSDRFALDYISASTILRQVLGDTSGHWTPAFDLRRNDLSLERRVDHMVHEAFQRSSDAVFDCWGLPWIAHLVEDDVSVPAVFIWIESDWESRYRKCFVSYLERGELKTSDECRDIVIAKDTKSREIFLANWGFDIYADRSTFNMVLDASSLIPSADLETAQRGAQALYQACLHGLHTISDAVPSVSTAAPPTECEHLMDALIVTLRAAR